MWHVKAGLPGSPSSSAGSLSSLHPLPEKRRQTPSVCCYFNKHWMFVSWWQISRCVALLCQAEIWTWTSWPEGSVSVSDGVRGVSIQSVNQTNTSPTSKTSQKPKEHQADQSNQPITQRTPGWSIKPANKPKNTRLINQTSQKPKEHQADGK